VKQLLAVTLVGVLLGGGVLTTAKERKGKKHKDSKVTSHATSRASSVHVQVAFGAREIDVMRTHYAPQVRSLPPGLAKKYARTGQLPPGWQKKMQPMPVVVERELVVLPAGYHRGFIEGHAVIYNSKGTIIDVAVLF
jgi:hypothetical protein